ncbi:MAG: Uma2 family endonuclease, partial [Chloroflexota bacterium]
RLWDPRRGTWLPTAVETAAARRQAEARASDAEARALQEAASRQDAEARAAAAEAELARLRALLQQGQE